MEAVEAVEAVAVDEDLLEEGTGVVGKGNGRSTSQDDNSKHSMELATAVDGSDTNSISVPGPGLWSTSRRRQAAGQATSLSILETRCRAWRMLAMCTLPVNVSVCVVLRGWRMMFQSMRATLTQTHNTMNKNNNGRHYP